MNIGYAQLPDEEQEKDRVVARALLQALKGQQGVAEGAPELLKAEMPLVRHIERELAQHGVQKDDPEYQEKFKHAMAYYRKFGNVDAIKKGVAEGGPFSYGKKAPRKGSVADLAAQKRKEQDRKTPPIEPKDQMVGNAKITKNVKEGGEQRVTVYGNHHGYYAWTPNSGVLAFTSGSNGPIKIQAYWNDLKGDSPGIQRYVSNYMRQVEFSELPNKAKQIISKHLLRQDIAEEWSQKYKNSINCKHPKGFSQKAHCAGKRKHTESIAMEMTCPDCGMCETHGDNMMEVKQRLDAHCWKGKHKEGTKIKGGIRVNNCVPNESIQESEKRCMQCG
jgi:hypothetical protein